jgi:hypothetical protein
MMGYTGCILWEKRLRMSLMVDECKPLPTPRQRRRRHLSTEFDANAPTRVPRARGRVWPGRCSGAVRAPRTCPGRRAIDRFLYIAQVKCPYRFADRASALRAEEQAPG